MISCILYFFRRNILEDSLDFLYYDIKAINGLWGKVIELALYSLNLFAL